MAVYLNRTTSAGFVRLGISPRRWHDPDDGDLRLSTGPAGEFERQGGGSLFFSEETRIEDDAPHLPKKERPSSVLSLFRPEPSLRGVLSLVSIVVGLLLVLLGIAVVIRKGPAGWLEIALGTALASYPVISTVRRNRTIRRRQEEERRRRQEEKARNRELAGALAGRLQTLGQIHDERLLDEIRLERQDNPVPYEAVAGQARAAALRAGYGSLSRLASLGVEDVAREIATVADAVGLPEDDRKRVALQLYQAAFWHLAADDRLNDAQERRLDALKEALELSDDDLATERRAADEFRKLRGIDADSLPEAESIIALRFQEVCFHQTAGHLVRRSRPSRTGSRWRESDSCLMLVTSRRLLVDGRKRIEIPRIELYGLEVDVDEGVLTLETVDRKVHHFRLQDPIFTAIVAEIASTLPDKPAGLI